ncbi:MAG: hypothetical protein K2X50_09260 [Gammaproteobacteria bacterium]|nr:hypothetical protein [Gammaproteobacteria bacterium]
MTEILVSLGLSLMIAVTHLNIMSNYLQIEKRFYNQTLMIIKTMSAAEWQI